jgi:O-antigen ligase
MRSIARNVYVVVAWLFVAGLVGQVFLAGLGVFESPASFATHRDVGYTLSLFPVVLLVVGLLGGMGRRLAVLAVVAFGLFILQSVFVAMRESTPQVAALHPVNGFAILLLAIYMAREATLKRTEAPSSAPVAEA